MKLKEFRRQYPEYDDISDAELASLIHSSEYMNIDFNEFMGMISDKEEKKEDHITPALNKILSELNIIASKLKPSDNSELVKAIEDLKNCINPVINPIINTEAPIVNVPAAEIKIEQVKEWVFEVKRDRNGYIAEVIARS